MRWFFCVVWRVKGGRTLGTGGRIATGALRPRNDRVFTGSTGKCPAGGQGRSPLRKRNKRCNGRATARVAPTKALQGVRRGERNPPGTASPCQPPLGKGAMGTGDTDCHGQCSHWPRNDIGFSWGCGVRRGTWAPPYKGHCEDCGRTEASAPTQSKEMRTSTDGRGRTPPLRKRYKECDFYRAGRCGERTERCRWQRKRSERVAAVKIFSVRRKAAQKFWAPQQGHRPLRGEFGENKRKKQEDTGVPSCF